MLTHPRPDDLVTADRAEIEEAYRRLYADSLDLTRVAVDRITGRKESRPRG